MSHLQQLTQTLKLLLRQNLPQLRPGLITRQRNQRSQNHTRQLIPLKRQLHDPFQDNIRQLCLLQLPSRERDDRFLNELADAADLLVPGLLIHFVNVLLGLLHHRLAHSRHSIAALRQFTFTLLSLEYI